MTLSIDRIGAAYIIGLYRAADALVRTLAASQTKKELVRALLPYTTYSDYVLQSISISYTAVPRT